jgi:hypothetical protein
VGDHIVVFTWNPHCKEKMISGEKEKENQKIKKVNKKRNEKEIPGYQLVGSLNWPPCVLFRCIMLDYKLGHTEPGRQ